jgi:toxin ParE1/3/4
MKPIRFLRPAELEMLDAARFYEEQASGLGADFLDAIDAAVRGLQEHPERWPVVGLGIRRRLVARFPYALLYRVEPEEVLILATMHLHRRPGYWIGR